MDTKKEKERSEAAPTLPGTPCEKDSGTSWTRRKFLRTTGVASASMTLGSTISAGISAGVPTDFPHASETPAPEGHGAPLIRRRVKLGQTGLVIPDISFGTFSLESDEALILHALDRGITHFDTAESYTDGRSEEVLGRALKGRRHEVTLTTKFSAGPEQSADQQMAILERSLRRLQTDYVDLYLNHAVNDVARLTSPEWQAFAARAKAQGKIRAIGMSGHAARLGECLDYALREELVDAILVAYNFAQQPSFWESAKDTLHDFAASFDIVTGQPRLPRLLERAHAAGVGVMVMKTLRGARRNDMRAFEGSRRTFAQSAFRWVLSDPSVDGLVVSMNDRASVDEYVEASGSGPPDLEDLALLSRYEFRNRASLCTVGCGDCADACPAAVPIGDVMRMRMYALDYAEPRIAKGEYARLPIDATACLTCVGQPCANACSQGLAIPSLNQTTHNLLANGEPDDYA